MSVAHALRNCQTPITTYAPNTITDAPVARPSRPSVRFTPFDDAATITYAQSRNSPTGRTTALSRTNEMACDAGVRPWLSGKCRASAAKVSDTPACPISLVRARSPVERCLKILM